MALVKAGADVLCKDNDGYGSQAASSRRWFPTVSGRTVRPLGAERQEWLFGLCRDTALHWASFNGHTELAIALVKASADKDNDGYCLRAVCILVSSDGHSAGRTVCCKSARLATQADGAALRVAGRPHRDGNGTCRGGRGRALQGQSRVRSSGCLHPRVVGSPQCRGGRSVHSGCSCTSACRSRSACFGCAGGRRCSWRRTSATRRRRWRWSRRART